MDGLSWLSSQGKVSEIIKDTVILIKVAEFRDRIDLITASCRADPGIYAWYRNRRLSSPLNLSGLKAATEGSYHPKFSKKISNYSVVDLLSKPRIDFTPALGNSIEHFQSDSGFCNAVSSLFDLSILFDKPLYMGASSNIKNRIEQHLNGTSGLADYLANGGTVDSEKNDYDGIDIFQTSLVVIYMDDVEESLVNDLPEGVKSVDKVLEHIAQILYRPEYVRRLG